MAHRERQLLQLADDLVRGTNRREVNRLLKLERKHSGPALTCGFAA
jgi:hypothetical protein